MSMAADTLPTPEHMFGMAYKAGEIIATSSDPTVVTNAVEALSLTAGWIGPKDDEYFAEEVASFKRVAHELPLNKGELREGAMATGAHYILLTYSVWPDEKPRVTYMADMLKAYKAGLNEGHIGKWTVKATIGAEICGMIENLIGPAAARRKPSEIGSNLPGLMSYTTESATVALEEIGKLSGVLGWRDRFFIKLAKLEHAHRKARFTPQEIAQMMRASHTGRPMPAELMAVVAELESSKRFPQLNPLQTEKN